MMYPSRSNINRASSSMPRRYSLLPPTASLRYRRASRLAQRCRSARLRDARDGRGSRDPPAA